MAKKTFLEEELERERRLRGESTRKRAKDSVGTRHAERAQAIVAAKEADRIGLFLTPNEVRMQYGYPTISDDPQSGILEKTSVESLRQDIFKISQDVACQDMYTAALLAMRKYGKGD